MAFDDHIVSDLTAENRRLRIALEIAADRLGFLSSVLSRSNRSDRATEALTWSQQARAAAKEGAMSIEPAIL